MKLCGNVEISGIERIVFDRATVYELMDKEDQFAGDWVRTKSVRTTNIGRIPHQTMAKSITRICNTEGYRVRPHRETINIYSNKFETNKKEFCGNHMCGCIRHTD